MGKGQRICFSAMSKITSPILKDVNNSKHGYLEVEVLLEPLTPSLTLISIYRRLLSSSVRLALTVLYDSRRRCLVPHDSLDLVSLNVFVHTIVYSFFLSLPSYPTLLHIS